MSEKTVDLDVGTFSLMVEKCLYVGTSLRNYLATEFRIVKSDSSLPANAVGKRCHFLVNTAGSKASPLSYFLSRLLGLGEEHLTWGHVMTLVTPEQPARGRLIDVVVTAKDLKGTDRKYMLHSWQHVLMTPEAIVANRAALVGSTGATSVAINDYTCPSCRNDKCSKSEKSCWKCGAAL